MGVGKRVLGRRAIIYHCLPADDRLASIPGWPGHPSSRLKLGQVKMVGQHLRQVFAGDSIMTHGEYGLGA